MSITIQAVHPDSDAPRSFAITGTTADALVEALLLMGFTETLFYQHEHYGSCAMSVMPDELAGAAMHSETASEPALVACLAALAATPRMVAINARDRYAAPGAPRGGCVRLEDVLLDEPSANWGTIRGRDALARLGFAYDSSDGIQLSAPALAFACLDHIAAKGSDEDTLTLLGIACYAIGVPNGAGLVSVY